MARLSRRLPVNRILSMATEPSLRPVPRRGLLISALVVGLVLALVVINGVISRNSSGARLKELADVAATPTVIVVMPKPSTAKSSLDLPGRLEAYSRAPIYARVSGFLKAWYVDIGAPVKAGQLMAEIEAPDV